MNAIRAVIVALLAVGCVTDHAVGLEIVPPRGPDGGPDVPPSVAMWEISITRLANIESCPTAEEAAAAAPIGTVGGAQAFDAASGMGMAIGEVPAGRWAVAAIGRDVACAPVLYGCRAVNIGSAVPDVISVAVEPVSTLDTCGACRTCNAGVCDPLDQRCTP